MKFKLHIWRQAQGQSRGEMKPYEIDGITGEMSFLETLDKLNEELIQKGEDPIAFDSDCREGICGNCGLIIGGIAHGPKAACTTCEVRMRDFTDGQTITVEPFRARAFPIIKDLVVNRSAFDRIIGAGGYVSVSAGAAPDANAIPVPKIEADAAMDAATCIGCGACVAACPNASASLFTSAKIAQFTFLPQGQAERSRRAINMVNQMDNEGFGDCSNHAECEAVCPKEISIKHIGIMRKEFFRAATGK